MRHRRAVGDSFVSGEGAGAYAPVVDIGGTARSFPGWSATNSDAFFCHRSANASLHRADLAGIHARFNLACSGGQPHDIADPSQERPRGRDVAATWCRPCTPPCPPSSRPPTWCT